MVFKRGNKIFQRGPKFQAKVNRGSTLLFMTKIYRYMASTSARRSRQAKADPIRKYRELHECIQQTLFVSIPHWQAT